MARATKQQGKSEPPQNRLAIQDLWEKKQHSTVRKPGLPPARSPEITQSKPRRDNISQIYKSRLAMTPSRSQRDVKRSVKQGYGVKNGHASTSQIPFFLTGALCLSAGHGLETYSSTTSRSRPRTRGPGGIDPRLAVYARSWDGHYTTTRRDRLLYLSDSAQTPLSGSFPRVSICGTFSSTLGARQIELNLSQCGAVTKVPFVLHWLHNSIR